LLLKIRENNLFSTYHSSSDVKKKTSKLRLIDFGIRDFQVIYLDIFSAEVKFYKYAKVS